MKFQFSIRDLLLIVVIAALAAGWWIDHRRLSKDPIQKWEYDTEIQNDRFLQDPLLRKRGDQGWELVDVDRTDGHAIIYFKRAVK